MTRKNVQVLAAIVVALVLTILVVETTDDPGSMSEGQPLLPGFSEQANEARHIRVLFPDSDSLAIRREADNWVISARDNYVADLGKLRQLVLALAEARIIEEKTSNPDLYEKLGVDDPEDDGSGTKVSVSGEGFSYSVILGDAAKGDHRYARLADGQSSYLIDRDPDLSQEIGDWLHPDILDIDSNRVRNVSIQHEDGEKITIEKSAEELTDFTVLDIPEGRDLSYAAVGNGIAGVLSQLKLDDVRKASEDAPLTSVVFDTWDGLQIRATVSTDNEESWVAFTAEETQAESDTESPEDPDEQALSVDPDESAAEINTRLSGWQYRLPDHKKNLLVRRWEDILKSTDED
jgi:hypothetical protein